MTRINCVPVGELQDKHLVAEYRELPRVFRLARVLSCEEKIEKYRLGNGHIKFFYDKLGWLTKRHREIVSEMQSRGFKVNYPTPPRGNAHLYGDWEPSAEDMVINRQRIKERSKSAVRAERK